MKYKAQSTKHTAQIQSLESREIKTPPEVPSMRTTSQHPPCSLSLDLNYLRWHRSWLRKSNHQTCKAIKNENTAVCSTCNPCNKLPIYQKWLTCFLLQQLPWPLENFLYGCFLSQKSGGICRDVWLKNYSRRQLSLISLIQELVSFSTLNNSLKKLPQNSRTLKIYRKYKVL